MAVNAHARSEFALDYTIQYMKDRTAFGKSISEFQALRHSVVQLASEIELCKTFNYCVRANRVHGCAMVFYK